MGSPTLVLAGRYRLEARIAAGGTGEVWRGTDPVLGRPVAVKLLHAGYAEHAPTLARFRAEAHHAGALSHPGIAQVYDYGEDGQPFLVMELVDGPSLADVLAQGPLDAARAMDVIAQTAAALAAAHAAGLVHRDVKPANLLAGPGGQIKITDFGIAHAAGSAPLTRAGTLIGTPGYLAPERVAGQAATPASDLYSLGIVGYECLTGSLPFAGTPLEVALAHSTGRLPPLGPHVPPGAAALVATLTARDPAGRPASAADTARWATRLREALDPGAGHRAWPSPAARTDSRPVTRPAAGPGVGPATRTDPRTAVLAAPQAAGYPPPRRGPASRGRMRALVLTAAAVTAGLAAWVLASGTGPAHPAQQDRPAARASASPAGPRLAGVNQAALAGQPVGAVLRQLRQLGLQVRLAWQFSGQQAPGTVVSVQPSGQLVPGTTVLVTGAVSPRHHGHHGHQHGG